MKMFHDQAKNIPVYASYLSHIGVDPSHILQLEDIPFLPIQFFKTGEVIRPGRTTETVFESSGTTAGNHSRHHITDASSYKSLAQRGFEITYGSLGDWAVFALLPSYLDRKGSSLVAMADHFIRQSGFGGGFYLNEFERLNADIRTSKAPKKLLLGVSFALLDLAEQASIDLTGIKGLVVMETGGMKGKRREITREELHTELMPAFGVKEIHSEYGMTELQSQAYAQKGGMFSCPPWMQVLIRSVDDPFSTAKNGKTGGINVIDLANRDSCAFIATDDLGRKHKNGSFEVIGRFDHSDTRGCNLFVET